MSGGSGEEKGMGCSEMVVSSPYAGVQHQLDLTSVPETSQQLALALDKLRPATNDYPTKPYAESFNWQEVVDKLPASFAGILH